MDQTCKVDDAVLLDYLLGTAQPPQRNAVESSPACRAAAADLAQRMSALYRFECPAAELLVAYGERRVADASLALVLHAHIAACGHCREELALLNTIDQLPLVARPPLARRIVAALYRPALAQALRGDLLHYTAGQLSVNLRIRPELDSQGRWTVRGQLRGADGSLAADQLEAVRVQRADWAEPSPGLVEGRAAFRLSDLEAGTYRIAIDTPGETVEIADLVIGQD